MKSKYVDLIEKKIKGEKWDSSKKGKMKGRMSIEKLS
jgi:hypothetical protein